MPVDIQSIIETLVENGMSRVDGISLEQAEDILMGLGTHPRIYNENFKRLKEKGANHRPEFREAKSKYFSTVDLRNEDQLIAPHCEGTSYQIYKIFILYCAKQADLGGWNIFLPTSQINAWHHFRPSILWPVLDPGKNKLKKLFSSPASLWGSAMVVTTLLMTPWTYLVRYLSGIMRTDYVIGQRALGDTARFIRFSLPVKARTWNKALNGRKYSSPGFDCTYYDKDMVSAFRKFVSNHPEIYFDEHASELASGRAIENFRYQPTYSSSNDYSQLFDNALVIKAKPGELIIVDNRRYLHSATQFKGNRQMYAAWF